MLSLFLLTPEAKEKNKLGKVQVVLMEILLDTANLQEIKLASKWIPICGITTNPTIICREHTNFFQRIKAIKNIIEKKQLHVQVVGNTWEQMIQNAEAILDNCRQEIHIKIPATYEGFRAMKELSDRDIPVTATTVYSPEQAILATLAGADCIAVYYNKMYNLNMDPQKTIREISCIIKSSDKPPKILAASFRNSRQVVEAFLAGADAATLPYNILKEFWNNPAPAQAVREFQDDWEKEYSTA